MMIDDDDNDGDVDDDDDDDDVYDDDVYELDDRPVNFKLIFNVGPINRNPGCIPLAFNEINTNARYVRK